jgi:hypothetical protein
MLKVYFVGRVPKRKSSRRLRFESGKMKSLILTTYDFRRYPDNASELCKTKIDKIVLK